MIVFVPPSKYCCVDSPIQSANVTFLEPLNAWNIVGVFCSDPFNEFKIALIGDFHDQDHFVVFDYLTVPVTRRVTGNAVDTGGGPFFNERAISDWAAMRPDFSEIRLPTGTFHVLVLYAAFTRRGGTCRRYPTRGYSGDCRSIARRLRRRSSRTRRLYPRPRIDYNTRIHASVVFVARYVPTYPWEGGAHS
jgi:hypothetical protein